MTLFETSSNLNKKDDKTNIIHKFYVDKQYQSLKIHFSYSPKIVDEEIAKEELLNCIEKYELKNADYHDFLPVKNHITLSFDENGEYRGACHRHYDNTEITISNENSSPGIFNKTNEIGEWSVVLNVHYIACPVEYQIKIEGVEK